MNLLAVFDFLGTIAFAISGAITGARHKMDLFGINILAIVTATGGGVVRDIMLGYLPPRTFRSPDNVLIAAITANIVFVAMKLHKRESERTGRLMESVIGIYDETLFWFDTLGLAAFTVDGVMIGIKTPYAGNLFLLTFLAFVTGVGGGVLRDMFAVQMPDIFRKHIYAVASIVGGLVTALMLQHAGWQEEAMVVGFVVVLLIRVLARHFEWDLPKV